MNNEEKLYTLGALTELVQLGNESNRLKKKGFIHAIKFENHTQILVTKDLFDDIALAVDPKITEEKYDACPLYERSMIFGEVIIKAVYGESMFSVSETMKLVNDLIFEQGELK